MDSGDRKSIGLHFVYSDIWIGGSYYIINLIKALDTLEDHKKPRIIIYSETEDEYRKLETETQYPFLQFQRIYNPFGDNALSMMREASNKVFFRLSGKLLFRSPINKQSEICFPNPQGYFFTRLQPKYPVFWIPDFQEVHLPQFFTADDIKRRFKSHQQIALKGQHIVFSSQDALKDFNALFPESSIKRHILNFAVSLPEYETLDVKLLREKFKLHRPYFFAPNQFWQHKNQMVILEAVKQLSKSAMPFDIVFSGKMKDHRNEEYVKQVYDFVEANRLNTHIHFLGFIDRQEQLRLMQESIAVVQPSLFEGWSTVVEDAKAMNQWIILSDIAVHREQNPANATFFNPKSPSELAQILLSHYENPPVRTSIAYAHHIRHFAQRFLEIIDVVERS